MSKIKVKGHDSGTGVITIEAPNTSTDRTLTLPDSTGELLSTAGGTMTGDLTIGTVGSVTSSGADLKITGTDDIFFNVAGATNNILQLYGGSSANDQSKFDSHVHPLTDNSKDLGSATERWKDLYLSGGLKVGGTDAAHTLDDYEEGTWTPSCATGTLSFGGASYVKVGTMVTVGCYVHTFSDASSSAIVTIGGLPFTTGDYFTGSIAGRGIPAGKGYASVVSGGITTFELVEQNTSSSYQKLQHSDLIYGSSANTLIFFSLTYRST